jgi:hypothetical protein
MMVAHRDTDCAQASQFGNARVLVRSRLSQLGRRGSPAACEWAIRVMLGVSGNST